MCNNSRDTNNNISNTKEESIGLDCPDPRADVVGRPDAAVFIALSHASEEANVRNFAAQIATDVRELGLHHPRSTSSKFVTVTHDVAVADAARESQNAGEFLDSLLERIAE